MAPDHVAPDLRERAQKSYERLISAAKELNEASDELGQIVNQLDEALKKLGLGVAAEVQFGADGDFGGRDWWKTVEYRKCSGRWCICIGDHFSDAGEPDRDYATVVPFADAPRVDRIEAIRYIPELVEKLVAAADHLTSRVRESSTMLSEFAGPILTSIQADPAPRKR